MTWRFYLVCITVLLHSNSCWRIKCSNFDEIKFISFSLLFDFRNLFVFQERNNYFPKKFYSFRFTFRSFIHFELSLVTCVKCSFLPPFGNPVYTALFFNKDFPISNELWGFFCQKSIDHTWMGPFLDFLFRFSKIPNSLDYGSFISLFFFFKSGRVKILQLSSILKLFCLL